MVAITNTVKSRNESPANKTLVAVEEVGTAFIAFDSSDIDVESGEANYY